MKNLVVKKDGIQDLLSEYIAGINMTCRKFGHKNMRVEMAVHKEQIVEKVLALPVEERAALAERLFQSLEISSSEIDELWAKEAESRIDAFERGEMKAVPMKDVFKKIEARKKYENRISRSR